MLSNIVIVSTFTFKFKTNNFQVLSMNRYLSPVNAIVLQTFKYIYKYNNT